MKSSLDNFTKLYSAKDIHTRLIDMGRAISKKFKNSNPIFIGVLNGSFIFMADLMRSVSIECEIDFIKLQSYHGKQSTGKIQLLNDISANIKDRDVILVEDIVDTGNTVEFLLNRFYKASPRSVSIITLLLKSGVKKLNFDIDFVGFEINQGFVIGYGLDYNQKYRNLDSIYLMKGNSLN